MLTPTHLDKLPEPMVQLMSELQDEIISDICRRITKAGGRMTATAEWQLYKGNQLRESSKAINRIIAKQLKVRERTVRELYTDAVKLAIHEDAEIYRRAISEGLLPEENEKKLSSYTRSVAFNNALRQGLKNTDGLMRNLTGSIAANANRQLSDALDLAYLKATSGAFTPQQAIYDAVCALGAQGIKAIKYASGRTDQVDVAVRRAVLTGIGKTCCDMQLGLADDMGCELVEVSSHFGARPSHAEWQGQIYSLKKGHPKYPYFYDATGYGTGEGLGGWNCRHSFFPYFEGISEAANAPDFSKSENLEEYNNSQQQRAYERNIRKSKRELTALDAARNATTDPALKAKLDGQFERKSVILKNREARLSEFCKTTGRLPDGSRVRVDGFGRSISQKAVAANKRYSSAINTVTMSRGRGSGQYTQLYPDNPPVEIKNTDITNPNDFVIDFALKNGFGNSEIERMVYVREDGRAFVKDGFEYGIGTESIRNDLKNAVTLHCHPDNNGAPGGSFSYSPADDLFDMFSQKTSQDYVLDSKYLYSMKVNWDKISSADELASMIYSAHNDMYDNLLTSYHIEDEKHEVCMELAKDHPDIFNYSRRLLM